LAKGGKNVGTRTSMQSVAAYAGVSIATVSKVMQGVTTVLPENVTKVQNAIEALGYRINPLGAELRRGRRNLIGVIVPTLEDVSIGSFLAALEARAEAKGQVLFIASSRESEAREADLVNRMVDWRVAGVVVVPVVGQQSPAALLLEDAGLPAVYVHRLAREQRFDTISPDYEGLLATLGSSLCEVIIPSRDHFADSFWEEAFLEAKSSAGESVHVMKARLSQPKPATRPSGKHASVRPQPRLGSKTNSRPRVVPPIEGGKVVFCELPFDALASRSIEVLLDRLKNPDQAIVSEPQSLLLISTP
jgi:transcriptional regulator with XRE-family HTH domain